MKKSSCLKCGSEEVIPDVYLIDRGRYDEENLEVAVEEHPQAWLFKGEVRTSLKAWVCGKCGYTELYAKDPETLLEAYRKQQASG